jgi:stage II sporulation protein AB (anti-sigma F factor)
MKKGRFNGKVINKMQLRLPALSANEGMARAAVSAFCAQLDPAAVEIADIKCAVSEAVTNCIVHAYKNSSGIIYINVSLLENKVAKIEIKDKGCGIDDVNEARQPLFTTDAASERSGMGFTVMESFMDKLQVRSHPGKGTSVVMYKVLGGRGE